MGRSTSAAFPSSFWKKVHPPRVPLHQHGVLAVLHLEACGEAGLISPGAALDRVEAPRPAGNARQEEQDMRTTAADVHAIK
jgi:hypothetical protein